MHLKVISKVDKGSPFHSFRRVDIGEKEVRKRTILFAVSLGHEMVAKACHISGELCSQALAPSTTGQKFLERKQGPEALQLPLCSHFDT